MDDIEKKREAIKMAYPKRVEWHRKLDRMSSSQILAIYFRMKSQGKFGKT